MKKTLDSGRESDVGTRRLPSRAISRFMGKLRPLISEEYRRGTRDEEIALIRHSFKIYLRAAPGCGGE